MTEQTPNPRAQIGGNAPSKSGRDELVTLGLAERFDGWQWLNRDGIDYAITVLLMGEEKDKWQRRRVA